LKIQDGTLLTRHIRLQIAQGRLEAILNFQTMVIELTGIGTNLFIRRRNSREAMALFYLAVRTLEIKKSNINKFFI
jgi:glycine cleavage system pyridoxal-binding protein P